MALTAQFISDAIYKEVSDRIATYPCNNLRASNIGHPCERYLYLLIKHWEEQKPHGYTLQNIFDLGNALEPYAINKLKAAGLEVLTPAIGKAANFKIENPLITGREDIRIKDPTDGQLYPAEIKSLNAFDWDALNSIEDFYNHKRHHVRAYPSQLLAYMWHFAKEKGFFVLVNKQTGELKIIEVPLDWDRLEVMLKRAERVYAALADKTGELLPPACDDISVCEGCQMQHRCTQFHQRIEAEIDDGELEALILKKEELSEPYRAYNDTHERIKQLVGDREKVIAGNFLVTVKTIDKKGYYVEPRSERRINISRF